MRKRHCFPTQLSVGVSLVTGLLLSGCGYSIYGHSELPFTAIQIRTIENKTLEPKLQDKLHKALTEEFMKNGIMVSPVADTKLSAVIHTFDMTVLSEKQGIAIEYRVVIRADFTVEDKEGKKELKKIDSPFIVSFVSSEDISTLLAKKELAEERALKDVAMRIVGALIYK
jgi:outer membrane lipopolysaccharide assembly protein LptE/RlpB